MFGNLDFGWIIIWTFIGLVAAVTIGETIWLSVKVRANFWISLVFSVLTNLIGYFFAFCMLFAVTIISFAMTWDGNHEKVPPPYALPLVLVAAFLITVVFMIICKRPLLSLLQIQTGKPAWIYSAVVSVLSFLVTFGIPCLIISLVVK